MEVKPGYQHTGVGVIPIDWQAVAAAEFVDPSAPICYGVVQVGRNVDSGVPIVAIKFVKEISRAPLHRTSMESERPYARSRVKSGDVLVSIKGTIGRVGLVPIGFTGNISRELARLRPRQDYCGEYIAHQLESVSTQARISRAVVGTTRLEFSIATVRLFEIPVPATLLEQRAIATALSDTDELLAGLDRLIAKKHDLKQAAMQQLLTGQTRLPGFQGKWEVKTLEDLITSDRFAIVDGPFGSQLKVDEYVESGVPLIEMEHLCDEYITERIQRYITPRKFEDLKRSAVYPGDIIISKTGSLGKLGLVPESVDRGLITSRLAKITVDPAKADQGFVFQCLLKLRSDGYWEKVSQGGTMQILGIGMLKSAPLPSISVAEQAAIAAVLSDMDAELTALQARRDKTRALKQGMMQELLTGSTRLV
ncbi:restriction endonuclease subunit S [Rhodoferax sp.]|jgi:type I restriction enzyme S subunit|uniref:restriction endonuclease subunit S n=1 Tax=Rhodoferax sp. TaxID=50421 RepID=UPI003784FFA5